MPEYKALPLVLVLAAAVAAWAGLRRLGGPRWRPYAVPAMGAVLIVGLEWFYDLPAYAYWLGIAITPFLFHRSVKNRLERAARRIKELDLREPGLRLERIPDPTGRHVALWRTSLPAQRPEAPAAPFSQAPPEAAARGPGTDPLVMALDFIGEWDDNYGVVLWGETPGHNPVEFVLHTQEAQGRCARILASEESLDSMRGWESWMVVRSQPREFAFHLLDLQAFALLHELFQFRAEGRDMYVHVEGRVVRIGATRTFEEAELRRFLEIGARWIQKVRLASSSFFAPPG